MSKPIQKNKIRFQLQKKKEQRQPTFPRLKILYFQFCCATLIIKKKKRISLLSAYFNIFLSRETVKIQHGMNSKTKENKTHKNK